jgi:hypothetical protein
MFEICESIYFFSGKVLTVKPVEEQNEEYVEEHDVPKQCTNTNPVPVCIYKDAPRLQDLDPERVTLCQINNLYEE